MLLYTGGIFLELAATGVCRIRKYKQGQKGIRQIHRPKVHTCRWIPRGLGKEVTYNTLDATALVEYKVSGVQRTTRLACPL